MAVIQNPVLWLWDQIRLSYGTVGSAQGDGYLPQTKTESAAPVVRHIGTADVWEALRAGLRDFAAIRTDVIFLCIIYPVVGLVLAGLSFGEGLQWLFPLAGGLALVGPIAAIGMNEMSRRREHGLTVRWPDALSVVRSPSIGAIFALAFILVIVFLIWQLVAAAIYSGTIGALAPASIGAFLHTLLFTGAGWELITIGVSAGFVFALVVLSISVISFPVLLDRHVHVMTAMRTSIRAMTTNPVPMALWAGIITVGLVLGSIPLFVGLAVVMPVLGHASWHLYRKVVAQ
ncbi:DUF2189 domain-containing protein [Acidisoma cladoniae]|jgi:uncharacterized membrane protein|uniref:DUF2189 domain-containing protein n=1 Tax=Acidisoma cladoniae TaxID=3040935 RepID=UPI00254B1350|nr:DUF2189 domain-containing protein [Acidisoma sp. PAMC 29798]